MQETRTATDTCADRLLASLPAFALDDLSGEAEITRLCELAMLLQVARRHADTAVSVPVADLIVSLPDWVSRQASHPVIAQLVRHGPAPALVCPLLLANVAPEASSMWLSSLHERLDQVDLPDLLPSWWQQYEAFRLARSLALPISPPTLPTLLENPTSCIATTREAYDLTHEIFHRTQFGLVALCEEHRANAATLLEDARAGPLALGNPDLMLELALSADLTGVFDPTWESASKSALRSALDCCGDVLCLADYHPLIIALLHAVSAAQET